MIFYYWIAIVFCIIQSGVTSGLTLELYGFPRLRLESEAAAKNQDAIQVLKLRKDSHLLLATLIWANVSVNVCLAFLTESIMGAYAAFFFTTVLITFFGEIFPQAFISRRALSVGAKLYPLVSFYRFIMYPIARPTALFLDMLMGKEELDFLNESVIEAMLKKHLESSETEVDRLEGQGALNFLSMDDLFVREEGETLLKETIIPFKSLQMKENDPIGKIPREFFQELSHNCMKWVILIDDNKLPIYALNLNHLIRNYFVGDISLPLSHFCHHPVVVDDASVKIADTVLKLKVQKEHREDDVIDEDIILFWTDKEKKILTGADILGRLLRGIVKTT